MAKLYSIKDASHILNCNWQLLYRYHKKNIIPFQKMPGQNHKLIAAINADTLRYLKLVFNLEQPTPNLTTPLIFTYQNPISYLSLINRIQKNKIQPTKIIMYPNFAPIKYYHIDQLNHILQQYQTYRKTQTQYQIKYESLMPQPNTELKYRKNIDLTIYELSKQLQINHQSILQWILYDRVQYSFNQSHQCFFTPNQVNLIKTKYRKIPNGWLSNQQLAHQLNTKNNRLSRWSNYRGLKTHRILGYRGIYYTPNQVDYIKNNYQNKNTERI